MPDLSRDSVAIVIGVGPAGLSVGACLNRINIPTIILEQSDKVGASWHRHYDRLHLHTDKKNSELPFLPYPQNYPRYPSRVQIIDYLEAYAQKFHLPIRLRQQAISVQHEDNQWQVATPVAKLRLTSTNMGHRLPSLSGARSM